MPPRGRGRGGVRQPEPTMNLRSTRHQDPHIDPSLQANSMPPPPPPPPTMLPDYQDDVKTGTQAGIPRRGTARNSEQPSLASIGEQAEDQYSSQTEAPVHLAVRRAQHSRFSATPNRANSAFSQIPSCGKWKARKKLMRKYLRPLLDASVDLVDHLLKSRPILDEPEWEEEYRAYSKLFNYYFDEYIDDRGSPTIDPFKVADVTDLREEELKTVDVALSAANLARLMSELVDHERSRLNRSQVGQDRFDDQSLDDLLPMLQGWDDNFTLYICLRPDMCSPNENSDLDMRIRQQALAIRAQRLIYTLRGLKHREQQDVEPYQEVSRIFCENQASIDDLFAIRQDMAAHESVKLKSIGGWLADDSNQGLRMWVRDNLRHFLSCTINNQGMAVDSASLDLTQLESVFPLEGDRGLFPQLRKFAEEYLSAIKGRAGIRSLPPAYPRDLPDIEIADSIPRDNIQAAQELKALEARGADDAEHMARFATEECLQRVTDMQSSNYPPPNYPATHATYIPQEGVIYSHAPGQLESSQSDGAMYAQSAAGLIGQKRLAQDDEHGSQSKKRKIVKPRAKRKSKGRHDGVTADSTTSGIALELEALAEGGPPEYELERLTQRSREVAAGSRKPKEPKQRVPWTRHDTNLLIKLLDLFKCKWSAIETEINNGGILFDRRRDQQALRDKARLLKQEFLKADARLPAGFDLIILGKKERNAVIACGRNPDRKVDDKDEFGQPINTIYVDKDHPALQHTGPEMQVENENSSQQLEIMGQQLGDSLLQQSEGAMTQESSESPVQQDQQADTRQPEVIA